jgi:hypothetical protein
MTSPSDPNDLPEAVSRRVDAARKFPQWTAPPDELVSDLLVSPERPSAPITKESAWTLDWEVTGVRSPGIQMESHRVLTQVFDDGELALTADPPAGDRGWQIRGTVWFRDPSRGPVSIVLLVEDHVVGSVSAQSGETFSLEEFLPPGWSVEVHLPNGKTLTIADQGA